MGWVRYIGTGASNSPVQISYSMNQGKSWQQKSLLPGQSFSIPPACTTLIMDNVPYDPAGNYEIRDGKIVPK